MKKLPFNDDWLKEHYQEFDSYRELADAHNERFGTEFSRQQMKNHTSLILGLHIDHYYYTEEMKEWIRQEYPKASSSDEKARLFNERFGGNRKGHSIREMARRLGVNLSEEALDHYKKKSADHIVNYNTTVKAKPIGYVGRKSNGYNMVKTEDGWVSQARYEYLKHHDEIPNGYVVIFLDGDNTNVEPSNLMAIPQAWQAWMTAHKFWSSHPKITETGIMWCRLRQLIGRSDHEFTVRIERKISDL